MWIAAKPRAPFSQVHLMKKEILDACAEYHNYTVVYDTVMLSFFVHVFIYVLGSTPACLLIFKSQFGPWAKRFCPLNSGTLLWSGGKCRDIRGHQTGWALPFKSPLQWIAGDLPPAADPRKQSQLQRLPVTKPLDHLVRLIYEVKNRISFCEARSLRCWSHLAPEQQMRMSYEREICGVTATSHHNSDWDIAVGFSASVLWQTRSPDVVRLCSAGFFPRASRCHNKPSQRGRVGLPSLQPNGRRLWRVISLRCSIFRYEPLLYRANSAACPEAAMTVTQPLPHLPRRVPPSSVCPPFTPV